MRPRFHTKAPMLFLGLSLAGFVAACTVASADTDTPSGARSEIRAETRTRATEAPQRCEVALDAVPGGTRIEGRVISTTPAAGTYALAITSRSGGGQTTIHQSGAFTARPGEPALLGETELLGSPARHSVDLEVRIGGRRLTCADPRL